jgi:hypothetical protein
MVDATTPVISDAASRPRQLRPIKPELFTGPTDFAWIEELTGAGQGNFHLSAFPMDRHHDVTFVALMLMLVEPAPLLDQPLAECCVFHRRAPVDQVTWSALRRCRQSRSISKSSQE